MLPEIKNNYIIVYPTKVYNPEFTEGLGGGQIVLKVQAL